MIRIVCPSCHASLVPGGLVPVALGHESGLACPVCAAVVIAEPVTPDRCEVEHAA